MMLHPYSLPGHHGFDKDAHRAGFKRAFYYGSAGFADPRTYTIDPWGIRVATGLSWSESLAISMRLAGVTAVAIAAVAYLGLDPFDVTPGYGFSPGERLDRFGREIELKSISHYLIA